MNEECAIKEHADACNEGRNKFVWKEKAFSFSSLIFLGLAATSTVKQL